MYISLDRVYIENMKTITQPSKTIPLYHLTYEVVYDYWYGPARELKMIDCTDKAKLEAAVPKGAMVVHRATTRISHVSHTRAKLGDQIIARGGMRERVECTAAERKASIARFERSGKLEELAHLERRIKVLKRELKLK